MTIYRLVRLSTLVCILSAAILSIFVSPAFSQTNLPFVSPMFTDNMVLQRQIPDHVWGWTTPGQTVTVSFEGTTATAKAGADGLWEAAIGPFEAGGPYVLSVTGPQSATFSNVMVGDVWLCGGQSNMEFGVGAAMNGQAELAAANNPSIRMYRIPDTQAGTPQSVPNIAANTRPDLIMGSWLSATPANVKSEGDWGGFSAVGYFFGRKLQSDLNVPIGLIESCYSGTVAEAWTSREALSKNLPSYNDVMATLGVADRTPLVNTWYAKNDPGQSGNWQDPGADVSAWKPIQIPGYFQNAGIAELAHINGIVWFRDTFDLPAGDTGKDGNTQFQVDDNDTTWVNGTKLGATEGWMATRTYTIPASLLKPTGNVIVIRVMDTGGLGGIYGAPAKTKIGFDGGQDISLAGTWQYRIAAPLTTLPPYPSDPSSNPNFPTVLFNAMINPLDKMSIKGVIWYQGEANADRAQEYRTLLPTMIEDWRTRWHEGNFPFLIVQLAGYENTSFWPNIRQSQSVIANKVPNVGIVTAIDIGTANDIHPKNKQETGRRLALVAEAKVYHEKVAYSGPVYQTSKVEGSSIRISFKELNGGLVAKDGASLSGFDIAGADGNFVPATATIDGNTVLVSSPQVPSPVAVQYDWSDYPAGNLYNQAGLPTFPFKSDEK
jgi:sialate O-acetylesterase